MVNLVLSELTPSYLRQHRTMQSYWKKWYNSSMNRQMKLAKMNDEFGTASFSSKARNIQMCFWAMTKCYLSVSILIVYGGAWMCDRGIHDIIKLKQSCFKNLQMCILSGIIILQGKKVLCPEALPLILSQGIFLIVLTPKIILHKRPCIVVVFITLRGLFLLVMTFWLVLQALQKREKNGENTDY